MKIVVCVKQIIDPEIPSAKFEIDEKAKKVVPPEGIPPVINPFDAQAIEMGIRIKEAYGGSLLVLAAGSKACMETVRYSMAMGADEGIIIQHNTEEDFDGFLTAYILSEGIKKIGDYDLILCGRQAADWDRGIVGSVIAAYLNIPSITLAISIKMKNERIIIERALDDGVQILESSLPILITVGSEIGKPRIPTGIGIISAARKKITFLNLENIQINAQELEILKNRSKLVNLYLPKIARKCEIIKGKDKFEIVAQLARRIKDLINV